MINFQHEMMLSNHLELYYILISENHILRQINHLMDFSFVIEEVEKNYSDSMGRSAEDPVQLFKYLMLKNMNEISDPLVALTTFYLCYSYF
ncbi:hypothetical protein [Clostridium formicaceticum]|uniref:Transposase InsH N-terminal domain-containing protein n=1 Tax=Clostridium formicaceticum TaxID=1497 RepID=A0AAC9RI74_9CLOT|nr:hypothetical protein [Clostridium formicaceticum]AOY77018.1 hypothetical protein BJL90_14850 [Clostridium formicaceticum]ARE87514.1 hypothetical protein CLFO_19140 [Clostridium formicaceticum]